MAGVLHSPNDGFTSMSPAVYHVKKLCSGLVVMLAEWLPQKAYWDLMMPPRPSCDMWPLQECCCSSCGALLRIGGRLSEPATTVVCSLLPGMPLNPLYVYFCPV